MPARTGRGRRGAVKRKIVEVEEPPAKKYTNPWERDIDQLLDSIKTAGERGFPWEGPESNLRMMKLCAAPALSETREDRHKNQAVMVGLMDDGLKSIEARMQADLNNMKERLASADAILANLEETRIATEKTQEAKDEALRLRREAWAERKEIHATAQKNTKECTKELKVRETKRDAEQAVLDAINLAFEGEFKRLTVKPEPPAPVAEGETPADGVEAVEKKMEEVVIVEEVKPSKRSSTGRGRRKSTEPKEPTIDDRIKVVLAQMELHGAEESLMNSLTYALKKALDAPAPFDLITLDAARTFFTNKKNWAEGNLMLAATLVQEQEAKLKAATTEQEAALLEQTTAKEAVTAATDEAKLAAKESRVKRQDIEDHKAKDIDTRKRVEDMAGWISETAVYYQMFSMLRDRSNPPPPAPEPVEEAPMEAPVEEAAPMEIEA